MFKWKAGSAFRGDLLFRTGAFIFAIFIVLGANAASASITISPASLPGAGVGVGYDQTVTAQGGTDPYTFAVTSGSLPNGITLDSSTGVISGVPTTSGVSNFTLTATDATLATGSGNYSIAVGDASLTLSPPSLPTGYQGVAYSQTVSASGGTAPYTFSVSSGQVPPGLSFSSSGVLSGTPIALGSYGFIAQATDVNGDNGYRTYTVNITNPPLTISPTASATTQVGQNYSQTNTASGGTTPYTFSLASGALPAGTTLNTSTGTVSGTPTTAGAFSYTILVTDSGNPTQTAWATVSGTIAPSTLSISPTASATTQGRTELFAEQRSQRRHHTLHILACLRRIAGRHHPQHQHRHSVGDANHGRRLQLHHQGDR